MLIKNTMEFPGVVKKKILWNFPGVLVLGLKISDGSNKFCGVSRGEAFSLENKKLKYSKLVFQKVCPQPTFLCLYFLWNSPIGSTRPKFHPFIFSWHLNLLLNSKANKIIIPKASIPEALILKKVTITS